MKGHLPATAAAMAASALTKQITLASVASVALAAAALVVTPAAAGEVSYAGKSTAAGKFVTGPLGIATSSRASTRAEPGQAPARTTRPDASASCAASRE